MSMNLWKEAKSFAESNLTKMHAVNEIIESFLTKCNNYENENYEVENLYTEFYRIKKELQIYLNLYNNNNGFYKSCSLQNSQIMNVTDDGENSIIHLVRDFIRLLSMIIKLETDNQKIEMFASEQYPELCPYCDTMILPDDEKCSVCEESVADILKKTCERKQTNNSNNHDNKRMKIEDVNIAKEINHNVETLNNEDRKYFENVQKQNINKKEKVMQENTSNNNMKAFHDILIGHQNQWICEICQFLNAFNDVKCQVCMNLCKGLWMCSHCNLINKINDSICSACSENNKFMKLNNNLQDKLNTNMNKSNKKESRLYTENDVKSKTETVHIDKNKNEIESNSNLWSCQKCTFRNKSNEKRCTTCNSKNKHMNISNNKKETSISTWKCWKLNCQKMNEANFKFCQACKLDRNPPDSKTFLVKSYAKNEVREIWICMKCEKYNEKDKNKCAGKNCDGCRLYTENDVKASKSKNETVHIDEHVKK